MKWIVISIGVIWFFVALYIRERNRRKLQMETLGRVIGFKEGMIDNLKKIQQLIKNYYDWICKLGS